MLEEDLALANLCAGPAGPGHARCMLMPERSKARAASEDQLAFLRLERDYVQPCLLVERPNGDFAHTVLRQLYFAAFMQPFWRCHRRQLNRRDAARHRRQGRQGNGLSPAPLRRMGDPAGRRHRGSSARMPQPSRRCTATPAELFMASPAFAAAIGGWPAARSGKPEACMGRDHPTVFDAAGLELPEIRVIQKGGRDGLHGEEMGHLLAELQFMQRAYPGPEMVMAQPADIPGRSKQADFAWPARSCKPCPIRKCPASPWPISASCAQSPIEDGVASWSRLTPTYSGCPAVIAIEMAVEAALRERGNRATHRARHVAGLDHRLDHRRKAARSCAPIGIAPPVGLVRRQARFFGETVIACPRCGSSTPEGVRVRLDPCKAHYPATTAPNPSTISSASEDLTDGRTTAFTTLEIAAVRNETPDAVAISFAIPDDLGEPSPSCRAST
jgi:ring-1,2-phenylacetyl-CoA epoxidase subunit PaaC